MIALVSESLSPTQSTWIEALAPSFGIGLGPVLAVCAKVGVLAYTHALSLFQPLKYRKIKLCMILVIEALGKKALSYPERGNISWKNLAG